MTIAKPMIATALVAAALAGCDGSREPAAPDASGVDSTLRFEGAKRAVARIIEDYEAAIRADEKARLLA